MDGITPGKFSLSKFHLTSVLENYYTIITMIRAGYR